LTEEFPKYYEREPNHQAAAGIDRVSYASCGGDLDRNRPDVVKRRRENGSFGFPIHQSRAGGNAIALPRAPKRHISHFMRRKEIPWNK